MQYYLQLLDNLKKGKIAPVNLFYGPEAYLREQAVNQYKQALVSPALAEFNFEQLDGAEVSEEDVVATASIPPVLGDVRLVVVKRARFFTPARGGKKAAKKPAKKPVKEKSPLLNYIAAPLKTTCLIFETGETVDRRKKIFKEVARQGGVTEFLKLKRSDLARWVNQLAGRNGKRIAREGIELLLNRCGADMYDIYNEVNKLIAYAGTGELIGEEDVRFLVADRGEEKIFAVVDALGNQKYADALDGIRYLLLCKESPQAILGMLARQVRLIMQAGELAGAGYSFAEISMRMGVPGFVCKKALSQSKNFSREQLVNLLRGMLQVDEYVKTGKQDFYPAIEMLLMDTCTK